MSEQRPSASPPSRRQRAPGGLDPTTRLLVNLPSNPDVRSKQLLGSAYRHDRHSEEARTATETKPAASSRRHSDDMSKSPQFYGKPGQLEPVLTYCLVKNLSDNTTEDSEKCGTLASLFRGPALTWLTATLAVTPKILEDYDEFVDTLKSQFGISETAKQHQAAKALRNLSQKGSAQLYAIQLEQLCQVLGHSDTTQLTYFLEGLKLHVREALITKGGESKTYASAKKEAIRIDTELYNARRRGAGRTGQGQAIQSHSGGIKCHKCGRFGHKKSQCKSTGGSDEF
jgi:hypothetical protein